MGIWHESQNIVCCDNCSEEIATASMRMSIFKKYLRKRGWKIGMICLCPNCAKANPDKGVTCSVQ